MSTPAELASHKQTAIGMADTVSQMMVKREGLVHYTRTAGRRFEGLWNR